MLVNPIFGAKVLTNYLLYASMGCGSQPAPSPAQAETFCKALPPPCPPVPPARPSRTAQELGGSPAGTAAGLAVWGCGFGAVIWLWCGARPCSKGWGRQWEVRGLQEAAGCVCGCCHVTQVAGPVRRPRPLLSPRHPQRLRGGNGATQKKAEVQGTEFSHPFHATKQRQLRVLYPSTAVVPQRWLPRSCGACHRHAPAHRWLLAPGRDPQTQVAFPQE